jgi:hypothetical protein
MNIMDFAEAMSLYMEAVTKERQEADRLFDLAHQKFSVAVASVR